MMRRGRRARVMLGAAVLGMLSGLSFFLAACEVPRLALEVISSETPFSVRTPATPATAAPTPSPGPTLCAQARVAGKVCQAGVDVYLSTCCPDWMAITTADARGAFAFEGLTAGTFTVTAGLRSRRITLTGCYSQVNVDLCPPPTVAPTP